MKQNTINKEISFKGIGLHSGTISTITLKPSPENTGIIFRRVDIKKNNEIKALYNNVSSTMLGTTISNNNSTFYKFVRFSNLIFGTNFLNKNDVIIQTIEHLMASIWTCDIDNIIIEIDNKEIPIMDGSAALFVNEIKKAGIKTQNEDRKYLIIKKRLQIINKNKSFIISPADDYKIDIEVNFNYGGIGKQNYFFDGDKEKFIRDIALARTFCNFYEIKKIKKKGLAKGGSENNAMIYDDKQIINKNGLRCKDEVVKHKLLDCVGDMFMGGYNIKGHIESFKGGHTLHNQILKKIFVDKNNYEIV
jgi:UDP-3-O-[3-hydroxymyristoyl] N-acetylglucosamine deacetylase